MRSATNSPHGTFSRSPSLPKTMNGQFSVEVRDAPDIEGEGKPRRHPMVTDSDFVTTFDENLTTLYDTFVNATSKYGERRLLGWRPKIDGVAQDYSWLSYSEVYDRVSSLASGLASFGLNPKSSVGLYSINRPEWVMAEYACYFNNLVTVPLYDTLGDEAIEHICKQTEMNIIFASKDKAKNILRLKSKLSSIDTIVCFDAIEDELASLGRDANVKLVAFDQVQNDGLKSPVDPNPPSPDDLCTICYTSGTTGLPKGVMLSHKAVLADGSSVLALAGIGTKAVFSENRSLFKLDDGVIHISFLPLAHVYERVVMTTLIAVGASIGFYQGEILKLMDDISVLKPTLFCAVPRLLNRVYDKINSGITELPGWKKYLFEIAYKAKQQNLEKNGTFTHWLWDRLVFAPIRNRLGGQVSAILSGSAPLSPQVMDFLRICFSCEVYEGYGQTETSAGSTITVRGDWTSGQIGIPVPSNEIKLVDLPDMGYTSKDIPRPRGEICIRGVNCFSGYYKEPKLTEEALDKDGWVHTGDVGEWDEMGRLRIIDRKKNLFKLAQGEYISPEKIENIICRNPYIAQAYVEGNSLKSALVAIVVPDFETLCKLAGEKGWDVDVKDHEAMSNKTEVKEFLLQQVKDLRSELKGFEIPRDIYVEHSAFSIDNGLLTSTMKLKRYEAKKHYKEQLEEMYSKLD